MREGLSSALIKSREPTVNRFCELDTIRGMSILAMILYHQAWNLSYFDIVPWDFSNPGLVIVGRSIGTTFLTLVGMSLHLSYQRATGDLSTNKLAGKYFIRGIKLLALAEAITVITVLSLDSPIYFGVLHLIGCSIPLSYPFLSRPRIALLAGFFIVAMGVFVPSIQGPDVLLPLGLVTANRPMADFYPIFPWSGIVLIGIFVGASLYPEGRRGFDPLWLRSKHLSVFQSLGMHSLTIYLVHQPLLFGITLILKQLLSGN